MQNTRRFPYARVALWLMASIAAGLIVDAFNGLLQFNDPWSTGTYVMGLVLGIGLGQMMVTPAAKDDPDQQQS